jgi:cell pole-organizing protein PopZ
MAQYGSAQREPSMEEILASIRRIIEDNDTGRRPEPVEEVVRPDNDVAPSAVMPSGPADIGSSVIEVDAFRAELRGEPSQPERAKPTSLAEVQAQVAADQVRARQEAEREYHGTAPVDAIPEAEAVQQSVESEPSQVRVATARDWSLGVGEPEEEEEATASEAELTADLDKAAEVFAGLDLGGSEPTHDWTDEIGDVAVATAQAISRPSIISDHAGRQVAAAFGELSEAFAARSKKTFDDIAEEMLRPMLQDWLDNNLPLLVERLVREEIERVARGS